MRVSPLIIRLLPMTLGFGAILSAADILRVPAMYPGIQAAIDAAKTGDSVEVSPGIYDENINFRGKVITVASTGDATRTIIDGGLRQGAVVTFNQSETRRTILRGFTIRRGAGNEGGGITVQGASPSILDNIITDNRGCQGNGIGVGSGAPLIEGNRITGNRYSSCGGLGGGGIMLRGASGTEIVNNFIEGNSSNQGGGISIWAGGAVTVRSNRILNNDGGGEGGGISTTNDAPAIIVQNLIAGNRASAGGGIYWSNPPQSVINNTIVDNEATQGSALAWDEIRAETRILNNILAGKTSIPIRCNENDTLTGFRNNNVYTSDVSTACRPAADAGNIFSDPKFFESPRNYQLRPGSPAIDRGQASSEVGERDLAGWVRSVGTAIDMGAFEFQGFTSLTVTPSSLAFGRQAVGLTTAGQTVVVANTGQLPLFIGGTFISPEYQFEDTCRSADGIAPGGTCTATIALRPMSRGLKNGTFGFVATTADSPKTVGLTGEGIAPTLSFSSPSISFAQQAAYTASEPKTLVVTNAGDLALTVSSIVLPDDFSQTNTCSGQIAPLGTCEIRLVFRPTSAGREAGAIRLESNALESPHFIAIEGFSLSPLPTIYSVETASALVAGSQNAEVRLLGEGLLRNSQVRWNGAAVEASYVSRNELRVALSATALSVAGQVQASVVNGAPGGGESSSFGVTVQYPIPTIRQVSPASTLAGYANTLISVSGLNFFPGAVIRWNGSALTTTFVSRTELRAEIPSANLTLETVASITVFHPAPGGGESNVVSFAVLTPRPLPAITSISPSRVMAGDPGFVIQVQGSGFVASSVVQWNRSNRTTTWLSSGELQATISAADISAGGQISITVYNPPPGGGTSGIAAFTVEGNPRPVISAVTPQSFLGGGQSRELRLTGTGFAESSVVSWNGGNRPTTFLSATEVRVSLNSSDLAVAGSFVVVVRNPSPGGGTSSPFTAQVLSNAAPVISSTTPARIPRGFGALTLTVNGTGFNDSSVIRINGVDQQTRLIDANRIETSMTSDQSSRPALYQITVFNPPLGGGESLARYVPVVLTLGANDLVYDSLRGKLLASIPGNASANGNSVVVIDPTSGAVEKAIWAGSNPNRLAISGDSRYVYAALDGSNSVVRIDLEKWETGQPFGLGSDGFFGPFLAEDIEVMPGAPDTVAISRYVRGSSPRHQGVAIYRSGVVLPNKTPGHTGANRIEFGDTGSALYGYCNETTGFGFYTMGVNGSGVQMEGETGSLISGFGVDIRYSQGWIYSTTGLVIDAAARIALGTYARSAQSGSGYYNNNGVGVAPDPAAGKTFMLYDNGVEVFDLRRFTSQAWFDFGASPSLRAPLVRWGADGLAFRDEMGNVYVLPTAITRFQISGQITLNGAPLAGASVTLSGSQSGSTISDAGGNYSFSGLAGGGSLTVTPSKTNTAFTPAFRTITNIAANQTANFSGATATTYQISGRFTTGGAGVPGVSVALTGSQTAFATTDANGSYSFTGLVSGGSFTLTPSKANTTFTPSMSTIANIAADQTVNFSAGFGVLTISGNAGFPGVTMKLSGGQTALTTSNASGTYSFGDLPAGGTYTVTPALLGYSFTPPTVTFAAATLSHVANFVASPNGMPVTVSLDRSRLSYSARGASMVTPSQKVLLSYSGGGTTTWTAASNRSWLSVTPTSGTGPARLTVSLVPGSLPGLGTSTAAVTITASAATNPMLTLPVSLSMVAASTAPFGSFDTPVNNSTNVTGSIAVTGWALDDIYVDKVQIYRDPLSGEATQPNGFVYIGDALFVPNTRPDVEGLYQGLPYPYRGGWGYLMLTNTVYNPSGARGNGTIKLWAIATDIEGHTTNLGSKLITLDNANAKKPFGAIDSPWAGGIATGAAFRNDGWVLTPQPNIISAAPTNIVVYVDSMPVGRVTYNQSRADVTGIFPNYRNSGGPGAFFNLDTTPYSNAQHSISWVAIDDLGNADGIGSRFFFVENGVTGAVVESPSAPLAMEALGTAPDRTVRPRPLRSAVPRLMTVQETDRVEIPLPEGEWTGSHVIHGEMRPLPVGSTLDNASGAFYWHLGAGFLGPQELLFTSSDGAVYAMTVDIRPKAFGVE